MQMEMRSTIKEAKHAGFDAGTVLPAPLPMPILPGSLLPAFVVISQHVKGNREAGINARTLFVG
jgi:hypothetical protein